MRECLPLLIFTQGLISRKAPVTPLDTGYGSWYCKYKHLKDASVEEIVTLVAFDIEKQGRRTSRRCTWRKKLSEFPRLVWQRSIVFSDLVNRGIKSGHSKKNHALSKLKDFPRHETTLNVDPTPAPWLSHVHYNCAIYRHSQLTSCHPFLLAQWTWSNIDTRGVLLGPG